MRSGSQKTSISTYGHLRLASARTKSRYDPKKCDQLFRLVHVGFELVEKPYRELMLGARFSTSVLGLGLS